MTIHVGTSFNEAYYPTLREHRFLESLDALRGVRKFALVMYSRPPFWDWLNATFKTIAFVRVDPEKYKCQGQLRRLLTLQHGEFIEDVPGLEVTDYVLFVDGDITVQRQFKPSELELLATGKTYLSLNARGDGSLATELVVLNPQADLSDIEKEYGDVSKLTCFNCGVVGNTVPSWKRVRELYLQRFPRFDQIVQHPAGVQWLMSWIHGTQGFDIHDPNQEWVGDVHAHCHEADSIKHFGLKRNADGQIVRPNGEPVVFAHRHFHPQWQHLLKGD